MSAIAFEDIREGDVISYTRKVKVTSVHLREIMTERHGSYTKGYLEGMDSLDLVERPKPKLPTELGSVVKVVNGSRSAKWFLNRNDHGDRQWTSETGNSRTPEGFERFMESYGYTWEEVA